jgi:hypothetical protein
VTELRALLLGFAAAARNLLPILLVVALFQLVVMRAVPVGVFAVLAGLALVALGIALFLRGLELAVFPLGTALSGEFIGKGSLPWLLAFGFWLGFGSVIAEPALIAVALKAETVSNGEVQGWLLRAVVAVSVGAVIAIGILRAILNHPLHWYLVGGYLLLLPITYLTPAEVTGLAYDAGAVSANIVTVPLITALGLGLMRSLRGRRMLADGFGLIALAVLAPRIAVQLYGIVVLLLSPDALSGYTPVAAAGTALDQAAVPVPLLAKLAADLAGILQNLVPIVLVVLVFQLLVIRRRLPHPRRLLAGVVCLLFGLFFFTEGLHLGLFPVGQKMAAGLAEHGTALYLYIFAFLLGFAATLVEPALIAVVQRAEPMDPGRLPAARVRFIVATGVGLGLVVGAVRLTAGWPLEHVLSGTVLLLVALVLVAPRDLVGFCTDLGGIATSDVTVPVITALGVGLAAALGSSNVLLDGFGLVALASLYPIILMLGYSLAWSWTLRNVSSRARTGRRS